MAQKSKSSAKAPAKKTAAKKTTKKSAAKKAAAKKSTPKKTTKAAPAKTSAKKAAPGKKAATKKAATKKAAPAKKTAAKKAAAKNAPPRKRAEHLPQPAKASGYTKQELAEIRERLAVEIEGLEEEVDRAQSDIASRLRDGTDGAGEDQADQGSKASEREHEISLANNSRDLIAQNERAIERVDSGVYGVCESCGGPIGKARLQVFPRATLCVDCKQLEERR